MSANTLTHTTRRFIMDRLERLHESLENLGRRLREGIAHLVGTQIGEAIRDALDAMLQQKMPTREPDYHLGGYRSRDPSDYHRGYMDERPDDDFWYGDEQMPPEMQPNPQPEPTRNRSRWRSLLSGLVQAANWCLEWRNRRRSWLWVVTVGGAVGISTLIASPVVGGVVGVVGTAVLMTRLADQTTRTVGQMAGAPPD